MTPSDDGTAPIDPPSRRCFEHFTPLRRRHDPLNAYLLALASAWLYPSVATSCAGCAEHEVPQLLEARFAHWGFDRTVRFISRSSEGYDTQTLVAVSDRMALIAFRGTESPRPFSERVMNALRDWFATDADVEIVEVSDVGRSVGVHDGFHRALMAVADEIAAEVRGSAGDGCPLWITGHSMGGALGTLAAPWLGERGIEVAGLCTFGAPMAGDARLARLFRDRPIPSLHRYVRDGDPVPALPPRRLGYEHVCAPHVIREDGLLVLDDAAYEPSFDATRHPPRVYCEALHRALPDRQKRLVPAPPEAQ